MIVSLRDHGSAWSDSNVPSVARYTPWWAILGDSVINARVQPALARKDAWWATFIDSLHEVGERTRIDRPIDESRYEVAVLNDAASSRIAELLLSAPERALQVHAKWRAVRSLLKGGHYEMWITFEGHKPKTVYGFVSDDYGGTCAAIERALGVEFLKEDHSEYGLNPFWRSPDERELLIYQSNRTPEPWLGTDDEVQVRWAEPEYKDVPWLLEIVCTNRPEEIKQRLLDQVPGARLLREVQQESL